MANSVRLGLANGTNAAMAHSDGSNAIRTGLNVSHSRTVSFDGDTYTTAFNAFQAQKETDTGVKNAASIAASP